MDIINLPNPTVKTSEDVFSGDVNVMKYMYGDDQYLDPPPFNYYKYKGSFTSPPCEENVIWFVKSEPIPLGNTIIGFIRDSLNPPHLMKGDKELVSFSYPDNFDGSNREV
jgi:hypothetical protein